MNEFFRRVAMMNRDMPKSTKNIYTALFILLVVFVGYQVKNNPYILLMVIVFYFAIVLHEVAHGAMANIYGDPTAKIAGRLTLNPIKHIDIVGTIIPIVLILIGTPFLIGWAKPVPVNFRMLKNKKVGMFMVAIAGVAVNFLLAILAGILLVLMTKIQMSPFAADILSKLMTYMIEINIILGIFNLIPIPPLDGSRVIYAFADYKVRNFLDSMENYGIFIIIALMIFGVLDKFLNPMADLVKSGLGIIMESLYKIL